MLYAKEFKTSGKKQLKVNSVCPGFCKTAFNNYRGTKDPADGAKIAVQVALLTDPGELGICTACRACLLTAGCAVQTVHLDNFLTMMGLCHGDRQGAPMAAAHWRLCGDCGQMSAAARS